MTKIERFRQRMAENGTEYTMDEARKIYRIAKRLVKSSKMLSQTDLWVLLDSDLSGLPPEEKEKVVHLIQFAKDL